MAENESNGIFDSFSDFIYDLIEILKPRLDDENFHALTMDQLTIPIMLIICVYGLAIWIFLGEILI